MNCYDTLLSPIGFTELLKLFKVPTDFKVAIRFFKVATVFIPTWKSFFFSKQQGLQIHHAVISVVTGFLHVLGDTALYQVASVNN